METRWYNPDFNTWDARYGERVHAATNLSAPLHSHYAAWKVDLDVAGEVNSFETIESRVEPSNYGGSKYVHAMPPSLPACAVAAPPCWLQTPC